MARFGKDFCMTKWQAVRVSAPAKAIAKRFPEDNTLKHMLKQCLEGRTAHARLAYERPCSCRCSQLGSHGFRCLQLAGGHDSWAAQCWALRAVAVWPLHCQVLKQASRDKRPPESMSMVASSVSHLACQGPKACCWAHGCSLEIAGHQEWKWDKTLFT